MPLVPPEKKCKKCGGVKPISKFGKYKYKDKTYFRHSCILCNRIGQKNNRRKYMEKYDKTEAGKRVRKKAKRKYRDSEHGKLKQKECALRARYGIDLDFYNHMLKSQKGVCAVCGDPEIFTSWGKIKKLAVDHNHRTGEVRGLLCHHCNSLLGCCDDNIKILKEAIRYLGGV